MRNGITNSDMDMGQLRPDLYPSFFTNLENDRLWDLHSPNTWVMSLRRLWPVSIRIIHIPMPRAVLPRMDWEWLRMTFHWTGNGRLQWHCSSATNELDAAEGRAVHKDDWGTRNRCPCGFPKKDPGEGERHKKLATAEVPASSSFLGFSLAFAFPFALSLEILLDPKNEDLLKIFVFGIAHQDTDPAATKNTGGTCPTTTAGWSGHPTHSYHEESMRNPWGIHEKSMRNPWKIHEESMRNLTFAGNPWEPNHLKFAGLQDPTRNMSMSAVVLIRIPRIILKAHNCPILESLVCDPSNHTDNLYGSCHGAACDWWLPSHETSTWLDPRAPYPVKSILVLYLSSDLLTKLGGSGSYATQLPTSWITAADQGVDQKNSSVALQNS